MSTYAPMYWKTELITKRQDGKCFATLLYIGPSRKQAMSAAEGAMCKAPAGAMFADVLYTSSRGDQFFGRYRSGEWVHDVRKEAKDASKTN